MLLALALAGVLGIATSAAAVGPGPETRVRANATVTVDAVGQPSSETAGGVGCLRPARPAIASGSCVATNTAGVVEDAASGQVTVLGRFRGGTEEYLGKPGFNVLDLPSKGTGRWYWSRNEAFIDDAIAAGDEIRLVTNPYEPIYSGGNTFQREIRYLKDLGYTFQESGDHWVAVPGR